MTYALVTDIANEFRSLEFTATSDITDARVQSYLDQAEARINLCLGQKYVLPITGSESLEYLKRIEIAIVAARVASVIDLKQSTQPNTIKQEYNKRNYADWAEKELKKLKDLEIILQDAVLLDSDFGMSSYNTDNDIEPFFKKDVQQW